METLLVYKGDLSNRYWKITVSGRSFSILYGRVGSVGSTKTRKFVSDEACLQEAEKQIQLKLTKGYVGLQSTSLIFKKSTFTDEMFWELVEISKQQGETVEDQLEWLVSDLAGRPVSDIVKFEYYFNQNFRKSFTADLWAATYISIGELSEESFFYFRAWMLFLGREAYEAAIADPETLLPHLKEVEEQDRQPQLEEFLSVAALAYEQKTGLDDNEFYKMYHLLVKDFYLDPRLSFDWDENDEESLMRKYPRLWEEYGENHL